MTQGDRVVLQGLRHEDSLNGLEGVIIAWQEDRHRWQVQLCSQPLGTTICVAPRNLQYPDETATAPGM